MDVTLIVEDSGVFEERETDLGVVEDVPLSNEYGTDYAKVTFENPLEEVLKDPEIQVVCRNETATSTAAASHTRASRLSVARRRLRLT